MDIMALTSLKCLPSPPPWLWDLENGLHDNLRGVKVGGSDIQLSYQPVGHTTFSGVPRNSPNPGTKVTPGQDSTVSLLWVSVFTSRWKKGRGRHCRLVTCSVLGTEDGNKQDGRPLLPVSCTVCGRGDLPSNLA